MSRLQSDKENLLNAQSNLDGAIANAKSVLEKHNAFVQRLVSAKNKSRWRFGDGSCRPVSRKTIAGLLGVVR